MHFNIFLGAVPILVHFWDSVRPPPQSLDPKEVVLATIYLLLFTYSHSRSNMFDMRLCLCLFAKGNRSRWHASGMWGLGGILKINYFDFGRVDREILFHTS